MASSNDITPEYLQSIVKNFVKAPDNAKWRPYEDKYIEYNGDQVRYCGGVMEPQSNIGIETRNKYLVWFSKTIMKFSPKTTDVYFNKTDMCEKYVIKHEYFNIELCIFLINKVIIVKASNENDYWKITNFTDIVHGGSKYFPQLITIINSILLNNNVECIYQEKVYNEDICLQNCKWQYTHCIFAPTNILQYKVISKNNQLPLLQKESSNITLLIDKYYGLLKKHTPTNIRWFQFNDNDGKITYRLFNKQTILRTISIDIDNMTFIEDSNVMQFINQSELCKFIEYQIESL
jgi:hypothetical protein